MADNAYTATISKTDSAVPYKVTASVATKHGATKTYEKTFTIDGKAPVLSVVWNDESIASKRKESGDDGVWVYGAERVATVSITDETGLNAEELDAVKTAFENAGGTVSNESKTGNPVTAYSAKVTFSASK